MKKLAACLAALALIAVSSSCTTEQTAKSECAEVAHYQKPFLECVHNATNGINDANGTDMAQHAGATCRALGRPYINAETRCFLAASYMPGHGPKLTIDEAREKAKSDIEDKMKSAITPPPQ